MTVRVSHCPVTDLNLKARMLLWQQIGRLLVTKELRPPRTRELAAEIGVALKQIESLLNRAASMGLVPRVADNRYFLPETLLELAEIAERGRGQIR